MNENDGVSLKDLIQLTIPFINALVETYITPKLKAFNKSKFITNKRANSMELNFKEYYYRTYKKLVVINTLVFNNSQRFLTDIYIPLRLRCKNDESIYERIVGYPSRLSDKFGNILITDTAGMGKSTLMKYIFIDLINQNKGVPLFIELRRLTKNKKIIDEIQEQLNSINKLFDHDFLIELLVDGGFIIILDGYDEISLLDKDEVTADLQQFISQASNNRFFLTSRPEKSLSSFGNFQEFKIEPLSIEEAFELLRKYDSKGQISSLLIKKLTEDNLSNIGEFLTNPLLVSLLFTAFEHKQTIPFKKYLFYRQVYDANFESHDLTKGDSFSHEKYSHLEIDDFHMILRHIAFSCLKLQKIEFFKDELLKLIGESKEFCAHLIFKESDFLQDILKTVPLFTQDGNFIRWTHKSLQEYFAAQFIYLDSKSKQDQILRKMAQSNIERYINVLDLYYDMDYKTFRNTVEYDLLINYQNHYAKKNKKTQKVPNDLLKERIELTFLKPMSIFKATRVKKAYDSEKIDNLLAAFNKKYKTGDENGIVIFELTKELNVILLYHSNFVLHLFVEKKNPLVKKFDVGNDLDEKSLRNIYIDKDYTLIDIEDLIINESDFIDNYHKVNKLYKSLPFNNLSIDHDIALVKLSEIKKSIESEKNNDFL